MSESEGPREAVGERLRTARTFLNLRPGFVASQVGLTEDALAAIEAGKRAPDPRELAGLAQLYRLPQKYLLTGTDSSLADGELRTLGRATGSITGRDREVVERFAVFLSNYRRPVSPDE